MKKRLLSILLAVSLIASCLCVPALAAELPGRGEDVIGKDLSSLDLKDQAELIYTWAYDLSTKWPSADRLPEGFDPKAFMEWGKHPGLGIEWLHAMGYTGKGVNIAYIDLAFDKTHPELTDIDLHYDTIDTNRNEFHGAAVTSLLAGREIGTAPDATVYFEGHRGWSSSDQADQAPHAEGIRRIIKLNEGLPVGEKIKVIGFSDNIDEREKNVEDFRAAVQEAKTAGIYVFFCGELTAAVAKPLSDRNDPANYYAIDWSTNKLAFKNGELYVPMDRTVASVDVAYSPNVRYNYIKFYLGGLSWTAPYVTGLMAIGLQIDPALTGEKMLSLMKETAYKPAGITSGGLIDPVAFARRVAKDAGKELSPLGDYTLCLYNSDKVSSADLAALKSCADSVAMSGEQAAVLLDVKGKNTAAQVYETIRTYRDKSSGTLAGVQIFGTAADVPAFEVKYEADMGTYGIDRMGTYYSDYFYGNLDNETSKLAGFSIYKNFDEKLEVDLIQDWPVARLPLTKGDYQAYFNKAYDYAEQVGEVDRPRLVNFDGPIFRQQNHTDDLGWFLQNRMEKEFRILKSGDYTVYGNQQGLYPVNAKVAGDITPENLETENKKGVMDLLINSHGQKDNIDRAFFVNHSDAEQYSNTARQIQTGENNIDEVRVTLVNTSTINDVLGENYYNLMTWTCNNAEGLDTKNLAYTALKGNAVNVFAATHIISNNGVNNKASVSQMKNNNFTYFYYSFLKYYYGGKSRGDSFWLAKKDYVEGCLANPQIPNGEGNYQFNLNNALVYQHLGLLQIPGHNSAVSAAEPTEPEVSVIPVLGKFRDGNAMLPMRALFEAMGYKVDWNGDTQAIMAGRGDEYILMNLGKTEYMVNGQSRTLPVAPIGENGTSYVPVRAVSEAAGCEVIWHGEDYTVTVKGDDFEFLIRTDLTPGV